MRNFFSIAALAALASHAVAQTSTTCNPLTNSSCPADSALGTEHLWWFNETLDSTIWDMTDGAIDYTTEGAEFTLKTNGSSLLLKSNFYIFFGVVESWVKMAKGAGIISSVVLESDDLDEIDWEWVGYNTSEVQTDFFGKGNTTTYDRGANYYVENADTEFHNYTTYWDQDRLEWWVDGDLVRTVNYSEALTVYGRNYPQTPCQVEVGIWASGEEGESAGTIEWGGGLVDWDDAPFTMVVQKIRVHDFHTGKEYKYGNESGDWQSIEVISGNSTTVTELNKTPPETLAEKWAKLGEAAHIGIYVSAGVVGAAAIGAFAFWCIRQRRKGRLENALDDTRYNDQLAESENFQNDWKMSEWRNSGYRQVS
ncbi:hypothetical protein N7493_011058 [Penicillium malachiteum]|uniref:chitinase n=1 Tax=Penicillium malachiteum TaxID=1324776 RepID=A0AAD6HBE9_9EURO|nr:hypothetical protein N7493_011058 [Penicillium malachiteum]